MLNEYKIKEHVNEIIENYSMSGKDELIIVCIGTDKCIGDSVAPMVGTFIEESNNNITIYGTLEKPVHALNMEERFEEMHKNHPNAYIIAIDACLGDEEDIGEIRLRDYALSPGKGVGKSLPEIGDMSIVGIVDSSDNSEFFFSRSIRLSFIWDMAKSVTKIIENTYKELENLNNDIALTI